MTNKHDELWTRPLSDAALKEGWNIWRAFGGGVTGYQIQRVDCPDEGEGELPDDETAWRLVWLGTGEHHKVAKEIIRCDSPMEFALVEAYINALEVGHAGN